MESNFKDTLAQRDIFPFIGVYDAFSATIAARHFDGVFLSGLSFAASHYGLPDIGFNTWTDMAAFAHRVKAILPDTHILVDIDDGFVDVETACHLISLLESIHVSAVVIEDQKRPRRCGHFDNKRLMKTRDFCEKLESVLSIRKELFVIARTDASEPGEIEKRILAFAGSGADAVLVDGISDLQMIRSLKEKVRLPFAFNQIPGGKSPAYGFESLKNAGVSIAIHSAPCLFAAGEAVDRAMVSLKENGKTPFEDDRGMTLPVCSDILNQNLLKKRQPA